MNNVAINLLPNNCTTSQASTGQSLSSTSSTSSQSKSQNSFSDTLNKAVTGASDTTAKDPEQATADKPINSAGAQNVSPQNGTDSKGQTPASANKATETDNNESEKNAAQPQAQDALSSFINAAVVTAMLMGVPAANAANTNTQPVAAGKQTATAVTAVTAGQSQPTVGSTGITLPAQQATASIFAGNLNQKDQANTLPAGQANPQTTGESTGSIVTALAGNTVAQENGQPNSTQNQNVTAAVTLNPNEAVLSPTTQQPVNANPTILSQTINTQNQAVKVEITTNPNGVVLPQATANLQSQAAKPATVQDANDQATGQNQLPMEQTTIPAVGTNPQGKNLSSDFNGEGQKNTLTDAKILKVTQDLPKNTEGTNSSSFSQNLNAALLSANGIVAAANTAETQASSTPLADVRQVLDQIVEQAKIITQPQNTEMVMKLKPEHLGELTLKVAIENGVVNASFHSNNPEVRSLIETSLPQLKQELANTGLKVDNVSVYAGLSQFQPNQGQSQNSRQQLLKTVNKKAAKDFVEAIDTELASGGNSGTGSQSGVDYRI